MFSKEHVEGLLTKGRHFCAAPWVHLHVTGLGFMAPCCQQSQGPDSKGYGSLNSNSFDELWQGEEIRYLRLKFLNDEMDIRCAGCYENEKLTGYSLRKDINTRYKKYADSIANTWDSGYAPDAKPVYWDIRFSNMCNLRCRSCSFSSSSAWFKDAKALGLPEMSGISQPVQGVRDTGKLLADLEDYFQYAEKLFFAGGEPLLMQENYFILKKLDSIKKHDVALEYVTNFTQLPQDSKYIKLWKSFRKLSIIVSLDGSGVRGEYLRKGLVWEDAVESLQYLKQQCPHADIVVNYTVSAFNILHLPDFHREMVEKGYLTADKVRINILHAPEYYSIRILPQELKQLASEKITEHLGWLAQQKVFKNKMVLSYYIEEWRSCFRHMQGADWSHLLPKFLEYTRRLDELRKENCIDVFPELEAIYGGGMDTYDTQKSD